MNRIRGFEFIEKEEYMKNETDLPYEALVLPRRGTSKAGGYDFISTKTFTLAPGESIVLPTGIKAYMQDSEWLMCAPRSGVGFKYEIQFANIPPVIDADHYNNPKNEGHIMFKLVNRGNSDWSVNASDRIVQGVFLPYLLADGDSTELGNDRLGEGIGSTGE